MNIEELKKARQTFEHNIAVFICEELENFRRKTDCAISSVNVSLNEISSIGESRYYQIGSVSCGIDL